MKECESGNGDDPNDGKVPDAASVHHAIPLACRSIGKGASFTVVTISGAAEAGKSEAILPPRRVIFGETSKLIA